MDIVYKSQVVNRKDLRHEGKGGQAAFASLRGLGDINSITETVFFANIFNVFFFKCCIR